eukprot:CAMPEP_0185831354 /NCGR_PEP_ID=MMETSP1353-20130828/1439_1 /TAXON_ID=1077150 /ORGANISM="Erythrolobus australicus, Strain CCMP3124" /LENGTH=240 /DNA_ID=CAMNT_0028529407 /DNA_START=374 /DNA_END=1096 /DNA_ORIENTATION=+
MAFFSAVDGRLAASSRAGVELFEHNLLDASPSTSAAIRHLAFVASSVCSDRLRSSMRSSQKACRRHALQRRPQLAIMSADRLESVKAGVIASLSGAFGVAPLSVGLEFLAGEGLLSAQWELSIDMLALSLFFFGIIYRYAVRQDESAMLRQGAAGAFAVVRAASALNAPENCSPIPLQCGPPLGYFSWAMLAQGSLMLAEGLIAFGLAALAMDYAFQKKWLKQAPGHISATAGNDKTGSA